MIMNKIVGMAALLLCLTGCVRDNDAIYYPVGDVDIERGGPALEVGEGDVLPYDGTEFILQDIQTGATNRIWISVQTGRIRWESL